MTPAPVSLLFAANSNYRYTVQVRNGAGASKPVLDITYTGAAVDFSVAAGFFSTEVQAARTK